MDDPPLVSLSQAQTVLRSYDAELAAEQTRLVSLKRALASASGDAEAQVLARIVDCEERTAAMTRGKRAILAFIQAGGSEKEQAGPRAATIYKNAPAGGGPRRSSSAATTQGTMDGDTASASMRALESYFADADSRFRASPSFARQVRGSTRAAGSRSLDDVSRECTCAVQALVDLRTTSGAYSTVFSSVPGEAERIERDIANQKLLVEALQAEVRSLGGTPTEVPAAAAGVEGGSSGAGAAGAEDSATLRRRPCQRCGERLSRARVTLSSTTNSRNPQTLLLCKECTLAEQQVQQRRRSSIVVTTASAAPAPTDAGGA
jgi:hypothetical protein